MSSAVGVLSFVPVVCSTCLVSGGSPGGGGMCCGRRLLVRQSSSASRPPRSQGADRPVGSQRGAGELDVGCGGRLLVR